MEAAQEKCIPGQSTRLSLNPKLTCKSYVSMVDALSSRQGGGRLNMAKPVVKIRLQAGVEKRPRMCRMNTELIQSLVTIAHVSVCDNTHLLLLKCWLADGYTTNHNATGLADDAERHRLPLHLCPLKHVTAPNRCTKPLTVCTMLQVMLSGEARELARSALQTESLLDACQEAGDG